jgi:hypothetical protein
MSEGVSHNDSSDMYDIDIPCSVVSQILDLGSWILAPGMGHVLIETGKRVAERVPRNGIPRSRNTMV